MAVGLNLSWPFAVAELLQAVQYADDSVEGWFRDGSKMLLAGCGSAFTNWSPVSQVKVHLHSSSSSWETNYRYYIMGNIVSMSWETNYHSRLLFWRMKGGPAWETNIRAEIT